MPTHRPLRRRGMVASLIVGLGLPAAGLAGAGLTTGCDEQAPRNATVAPAPRRLRIALVMKTLTNPFFTEMERGARRAETELDIDLVVRTAAQETSIEQQIAIVDDLVRHRVDAIVIAPGDSVRLIPVLRHAREAGIVVINIDNRLDPAAAGQLGLGPTPFISVDNRLAAYRAATVLAQDAAPGTEAAIIEGIRSAGNAESRRSGALEAFAANPQVTVVVQVTANWKIDEAYDVTRELLAAHPRVRLIFCANDMMALGTLRYLHEQGRNDIRVAGFDALPEVMPALRAGQLTVTVDQLAAEQGMRGVQAAVALLHGETVAAETMIEVSLLVAPGMASGLSRQAVAPQTGG